MEKRILSRMPDSDRFGTVANLFKLLGDGTRLEIFWILCHMEACICQLADILHISSPAVSHHIKLLKDDGLLTTRKEGKEVYYRASDSELSKLLHRTLEKVMQSACPMVEREDHPAPSDTYMQTIHDYLLENLDKRITIDTICREFSINPTTLNLKFKQAYGHSIAEHMQTHRMERAGELLTQTTLSVQEISAKVGYSSQSKFTSVFQGVYGITPLQYRKSNR